MTRKYDPQPIRTKDELDFAVFCIESVAERLGTTGRDVFVKLSHDSDILNNYIVPCYDVLHTQGREYVVNDIVSLMRRRGVAA